MPLHTENGQKTMGESLSHLICAVLNIAYPFSGNVNALMVCAVYRKGFAVQLILIRWGIPGSRCSREPAFAVVG